MVEESHADCVGRYRSESISTTTPPPKPSSPVRKPKPAREFDWSKYSTRFVAFKFAYLGQRYNGLEFHPNNKTPLPTVEEELWKALSKARLVLPIPNPLLEPSEPNWEGCEYSKCGRTDKGVSAFGQVIGIRVRSNRPVNQSRSADVSEANESSGSSTESEYAKVASPSLESGTNIDRPESPLCATATSSSNEESRIFDDRNDEIPYCQVLNRLLPSDIRVLAWCPNPPPDFSARFSCKERRYRYFFTQPAFTPTVGPSGLLHSSTSSENSALPRREGWLDIEAMKEAAHKFVGLHDFRNFCKLDPSKQIDNFERRIFHSAIEELDPCHSRASYISTPGFQEYNNITETQPSPNPNPTSSPTSNPTSNPTSRTTPTLYAFTLHGSAFLWHQVRHMAAILFLVGQGLEPPSLIDDLLNTTQNPCKPQYEIADDAPLVLWDCIFPDLEDNENSREDALEWVYVGDNNNISKSGIRGKTTAANGGAGRDGKFGLGGLVDDMWRVWRGRKMDEVLAGSLLDLIVAQGPYHHNYHHNHQSKPNNNNNNDNQNIHATEGERAMETTTTTTSSRKIFLGGDAPRLAGRYVPVMRRPRMESVEVVNRRYAIRKGFLGAGE